MLERLRSLWQGVGRGARIATWIVGGLVVLYLVAGVFLVPAVIRSQVQRRVPALLHRSVTLEHARFNPILLRTTLVNFDLRDRDSTPLFRFDTLVVNLSVGSVFRRALVLDEFRLVGPRAVARILADGQLALADLLPADTAPPDTMAVPTTPPRLVVHEASVRAGGIAYVDESRSPRLEMSFVDLGASVADLSTLPDEQGNHDLIVTMGHGARIAWKGTNVFQPLRLEGEVHITGIDLPRMSDLAGPTFPLDVTDGDAALILRYTVDQGAGGALQVAIPDAGLDVRRLAMRARGAGTDWVRVPELTVQGVTARFPQREAHVRLVRLSDLWVAAAREADSSFSWQPVLDGFAALGDTAAPAEPAPPWTATLDSFELSNGTVALRDKAVQPAAAFDITSLLVRLANVSTDSTARMGVEAGAAVVAGTIAARGSVVRAPLAADLTIDAAGLDVTTLNPYFGAVPPARLAGGTASARGRFRMSARRPAMSFDGSASLDRLALDDTTGQPLLAWSRMAIRGLRYTADPDLLRIRSIALDRLFARVAISRDLQLNLMALATLVPTDTTAEPLPYEIQEITLGNAEIDFSDESLVLPFRILIDSTRVAIRDVASFGGTPGTLQLEGRVEPTGVAQASGTVRLNDPFAATDVRMTIRNVLMPSLTPYSAQFAGYAIREGTLDLDVDYRIRDRQLQADHHLVMTNLALGQAIEGGESPGFLVKLALALLRDSNGRITIDAPVAGSVDNPEFSYRSIVWQAVKHVLGRVATAPFRFLGNLLGIGGDDVELVDFDPGRADLLAPERQKLDTLAAELGRRPELVLAIEGRYDSIADLAARREAMLATQVAARRDSLDPRAQQDTSATVLAGILETLYAERFTRPALDTLRASFTPAGGRVDAPAFYAEVRTRLLAAQTPPPGVLEQLARDRARTAADYLMRDGRLDTTRVSVRPPAAVSRRKANSLRVASELMMDAR